MGKDPKGGLPMSHPDTIRNRCVQTLQAALEPCDFVLAFWEAGSVAMGRADQYSDLDLLVLVTDGQTDAAVAVCEEALRRIAPIDLRYEVIQPSWHGHWQAFYHLAGTDPFLLVDLVVMETANPNRFLEPEIHGRPLVYFDKQGLLHQAPTDPHAFAVKLKHRLVFLEVPAELYHPFVDKELLRGRPLDALHFYNGLLLSRLIEALRMRYCPWRYNFGMRYLGHDLPPDVYQALQPLCFIGGAQELPEKKAAVLTLLRQTLAELKSMDLVQHLESHR